MSFKKASVAAALAVSMVSTPVLAQSAAPLSVAARSGAATSEANELRGGFIIPLIAIVAIILGILAATGGGDRPSQPLSEATPKKDSGLRAAIFLPAIRPALSLTRALRLGAIDAPPCNLTNDPRIVVVGLGYVGLPLAVALADHFDVTGFDVDSRASPSFGQGRDRTNEVDPERLAARRCGLTDRGEDARGADLYIVTVPTPVDDANRPDLAPLLAATRDGRRPDRPRPPGHDRL